MREERGKRKEERKNKQTKQTTQTNERDCLVALGIHLVNPIHPST